MIFGKLPQEPVFAKATYYKVLPSRSPNSRTNNVFWQTGYLELLIWFDECVKGMDPIEFPDFKQLALTSDEARPMSPLQRYMLDFEQNGDDTINNEKISDASENIVDNPYRHHRRK